MFRHLSLPCLALALFLMAASALAAEAIHQGKVVSAGENKITIVDQEGESETFAVTKDTMITRNGKPVGLDDIEDGDVAKITTKKVEGKEVAVKIEAKAKE